MKLFSIIIPSYNNDELLTRCLNSFKDLISNELLEFIVIDDCSINNQSIYIKDYLDRIIFIRNNENQGLSISRNIGINLAHGKYIVFVDGDDTVEYNEFLKLINRLKNDTQEYDLIRVGIKKSNKTFSFKKEYYFNNVSKYLRKIFYIKRITTVTGCSHIYNKKFIQQNPFPNKRILSEDLYHFFMVTSKLKTIICLPINYYNHHSDNEYSITNSRKIQMLNNQYEIYTYWKYHKENNTLFHIGFIFYWLIYRFKNHGKPIK